MSRMTNIWFIRDLVNNTSETLLFAFQLKSCESVWTQTQGCDQTLRLSLLSVQSVSWILEPICIDFEVRLMYSVRDRISFPSKIFKSRTSSWAVKGVCALNVLFIELFYCNASVKPIFSFSQKSEQNSSTILIFQSF